MGGIYDDNETSRCTKCHGSGGHWVTDGEGVFAPVVWAECEACDGTGREQPSIDWPESEQRPLDPARALEVSVGGGSMDSTRGGVK